VVLPRLLADRVGLTVGLSQVLERANFMPVRHRGRALVDAACALAAGATCVSDIEAMTRQVEIFGPEGGASDTTMLRVLDELSGRLNTDGLAGDNRHLLTSDQEVVRDVVADAVAVATAHAERLARHRRNPSIEVGQHQPVALQQALVAHVRLHRRRPPPAGIVARPGVGPERTNR